MRSMKKILFTGARERVLSTEQDYAWLMMVYVAVTLKNKK